MFITSECKFYFIGGAEVKRLLGVLLMLAAFLGAQLVLPPKKEAQDNEKKAEKKKEQKKADKKAVKKTKKSKKDED